MLPGRGLRLALLIIVVAGIMSAQAHRRLLPRCPAYRARRHLPNQRHPGTLPAGRDGAVWFVESMI
jgi:hypothetical protein